jgi:hypothetical protein
MRATLRLRRRAFDQLHDDLCQRHSFAAERVGFLFAIQEVMQHGCHILFLSSYTPLEDNEYERDATVGARVGRSPIRRAMQRCLTTGESVFTIHVHNHHGPPGFSRIDQRSMAELAPTFTSLAPSGLHGGIVLSHDDATCLAWRAGASGPIGVGVSIVGFPTKIGRRAA